MQVELAAARQERVAQVAQRASNRALAVWKAGMVAGDFDRAWAGIVDRLTGITSDGQAAAAVGASPYLARTAVADGITEPSGGAVQPQALTGVDASGRSLDGLLYGAVTTTKTAIGAGAGTQGAFLAGATYLAVMVHTAILDAGRSADLTAMTARHYTHYVRVVSAGACSRCAMLAGTDSAKTPFLRHPRCRCTAAPITDADKIPHRYASPEAYFKSLTTAEQNRVFTNAGAEAIRAGADIDKVVSARRDARGVDYSARNRTVANSGRRLERTIIGRNADGTPILGYTTGEGTTSHGAFAQKQKALGADLRKVGDARFRAIKRVRLMPETIIGLTDDVALRQVLLRDAGYLDVPVTAEEKRTSIAGYVERRNAIIREDRATADAFYREHGIRIGG